MTRPVSTFLGLALATMIVIVIGWTGCSDAPDNELEREIDLFQQKLASGQSFAAACQELDVLCKNTGFGCKAHKLFCEVPTKEYICNKLVVACANGSTAACQVYNSYCGPPNPVPDGGPNPEPDAVFTPDAYQSYCGDNDCDPSAGEDCQSCPQDCGQCYSPDGGFQSYCGDNVCDPSAGEDCQSCPLDCGQCYSPDAGYQSYCGDNNCDWSIGEYCGSCPQDCGECNSPDAGV